jgi:hypothetical protein
VGGGKGGGREAGRGEGEVGGGVMGSNSRSHAGSVVCARLRARPSCFCYFSFVAHLASSAKPTGKVGWVSFGPKMA